MPCAIASRASRRPRTRSCASGGSACSEDVRARRGARSGGNSGKRCRCACRSAGGRPREPVAPGALRHRHQADAGGDPPRPAAPRGPGVRLVLQHEGDAGGPDPRGASGAAAPGGAPAEAVPPGARARSLRPDQLAGAARLPDPARVPTRAGSGRRPQEAVRPLRPVPEPPRRGRGRGALSRRDGEGAGERDRPWRQAEQRALRGCAVLPAGQGAPSRRGRGRLRRAVGVARDHGPASGPADLQRVEGIPGRDGRRSPDVVLHVDPGRRADRTPGHELPRGRQRHHPRADGIRRDSGRAVERAGRAQRDPANSARRPSDRRSGRWWPRAARPRRWSARTGGRLACSRRSPRSRRPCGCSRSPPWPTAAPERSCWCSRSSWSRAARAGGCAGCRRRPPSWRRGTSGCACPPRAPTRSATSAARSTSWRSPWRAGTRSWARGPRKHSGGARSSRSSTRSSRRPIPRWTCGRASRPSSIA